MIITRGSLSTGRSTDAARTKQIAAYVTNTKSSEASVPAAIDRVGVRRFALRFEPASTPVKPGKVRVNIFISDRPLPSKSSNAGAELFASVVSENWVWPESASSVGKRRQASEARMHAQITHSVSSETRADTWTPHAQTSARSASAADATAVSTHEPGGFHGKIWIDDETSAARLNISEKPMM